MLVHAKIDCVKKYLLAKKNWPEEPLQSHPRETEKYEGLSIIVQCLDGQILINSNQVIYLVSFCQSQREYGMTNLIAWP